MKYENFPQAKELIKIIDETNAIIHQLNGGFVYVNLVNSIDQTFLEIGTDLSSSSEAKAIAMNFKTALILYYEKKLSNLTNELNEL